MVMFVAVQSIIGNRRRNLQDYKDNYAVKRKVLIIAIKQDLKQQDYTDIQQTKDLISYIKNLPR